MNPTDTFRKARDLLIAHRDDYDAAYAKFEWPQFEEFNWALDWFDVYARGNNRLALWIVDDQGKEIRLSFAEMAERSNRVANFLAQAGVSRGDRVLLMLPSIAPLWETLLACIKLGAVVIPATTLLTQEDLKDRLERGAVRMVITDEAGTGKFAGLQGGWARVACGERVAGWLRYEDAYAASPVFAPQGRTRADDSLLLYFTSGTTARPKLVLHTHQSYPVGHLSSLYWIGMKEGDRHVNISSPGWAKHAYVSFFAPWIAGAAVVVPNFARFQARQTLDLLVRCAVTTFCAPPTVWRMLILEDLRAFKVQIRELASAGEPLNPEVIERVRAAWGVTIRDGYGQTETTLSIGNTPGQPVKLGSMGRPLPGYRIALLDGEGRESAEGEVAVRLNPRPTGVMQGYLDDAERTAAVMANGCYRTGDEATRDGDGYYWYVGRGDDVFKSSDYRISPFELESALLEHPAVAEAAVVPSPDELRLCVPKAFVVLKPAHSASRAMAREVLQFMRQKMAPYKRIRRLEFTELPKTVSGKIRRVQLRKLESERRAKNQRGEREFWEEDFE